MEPKFRLMINEILTAAADAADPRSFIPNCIRYDGKTLRIGDSTFDTDSLGQIYLLAIGKAAMTMTAAADRILGSRIDRGFVLTKHIDKTISLDKKYKVMTGGHPVPTEASISSTERILHFLETTGEKDLVLFLISGGGSALLTAPREGISLEDWQRFSALLLGSGADICEFNTLRKHLDRAKGGGLALAALPSVCVSVILSDVVGSPLDVIASGPTVPDDRTFSDALAVLDKYDLRERMPASILKILEAGARGEIPETLKRDDPRCGKVINVLAADNRTAAEAACRKAREFGFAAEVITCEQTGEAREVGAALTDQFAGMPVPGLKVFGGETTVRLKGTGLGGRNQELALASVRKMAEHPGCALVTFATDGEDGPTDAAGAIVTSETLNRCPDPERYLENNDAYHYFEKTGGLLKTGPTGTNVCDLTLCFRF